MNVREMTEEKGEGKGTDLWRGITNFSFISIYCWKKNAEKLNFQHILIFVIFWGCCIHQSPSPIRAKLACTSSLRLHDTYHLDQFILLLGGTKNCKCECILYVFIC